MTDPLDGKRVLVVGASSGIGAEVAVQAANAGARVVVAARRVERLDEVVVRCGDRAHRVACDVRDEDACRSAVDRSVEVLGGLDQVVYATAVDPLRRLVDTDAALWHDVFATNVVGASLVVRAAIDPLTAAGGRVIMISATSVGRPLPGMGAYETSKAALEELVRAWRAEHPEIGFSNVAVGNTLGTEVHTNWDPELLGELSPQWAERGYVNDNGPGAMSVPDCAGAVLVAMRSPVDLRHVTVNPAPGSGFDVG